MGGSFFELARLRAVCHTRLFFPNDALRSDLTDQQIGRGVRKWRAQRSLTGSALAAQVGMSQGYISDIENGRRRLSNDTAEKIASAMNLSLREFLDALSQLAEASEPTGFRVAEDPAPYGAKPPRGTVPPNEARSPFELLSRQLIAELPREKAFDLVRQLTDQAEKGDATAAGRAQALLYILTSP